MTWDADFVDRSPMLEALRMVATPLRACKDWPSRGLLQRLLTERDVRTARGEPLKLVAPERRAAPYELRIATSGEMSFRERNWHDLFNVLAWATFPRTKAVLNARHAANARPTGARDAVRDALTLFDENGAIVASMDPSLPAELREHRWKRLFWERRAEFRAATRVCVFGHALFEKALRPYVGVTAHAVVLETSAPPLERAIETFDALAVGAVERLESPRGLAPLPLLGVPGWWPDNERPAFYDDEAYFRTARRVRA